jgi:HEAT repeat protein
MPIVPSRVGRVRALIEQLASERPADRESAVAQLTLVGGRAVEPLVASLEGAAPRTRLAAVDVLEGIEDPRTLSALIGLAADPSRAVALRALEVLGLKPDPAVVSPLASLLSRGTPSRQRAAARTLGRLHDAGIAEALDPLIATVVDEKASGGLRLAILDELGQMKPPLPRSVTRPLAQRLAASPDPAVAARAVELDRIHRKPRSPRQHPVGRLLRGELRSDEARALATSLKQGEEVPLESLHEGLRQATTPRAVESLAVVLGIVGGPASVPVLSRALSRLSRATGPPHETADQLEARAALHMALAGLESAVALHDLRELIARHPPGVMPRLLEAAARVGNASLIPALARAATEAPALLEACSNTYAAIARRENLRRSSAALRRVAREHRPALETFLAARRGPR